MKVLRYSELSKSLELAEDFLDVIGQDIIKESDGKSYNEIIKKIIDDLKINSSMVLTYGTGLTVMFPLVHNLLKNMNLKIEITHENIALMTITAITIAFLEEKKEMSLKKRQKLEKDSKSLLEELKLRGIGNGIIKKLVACVKAIGNLAKVIFKNSRHIINGFFDMFGYTALVIPVINAVSYMVNKYDINMESLPTNFMSLGLGITTLSAKHGLNYIIDLLKDKLKLSKNNILKGVNDIDDPILKKYPHPEYIDSEYQDDKSKLIKEQ